MQMRPMISILMPSYNHERFIAIAIESALKQKTKYSFELLINDDNSTDETAKIAETYSQRYPNIIRFFKQNKNQGLMKSYKFLLNNAKGEYIAILESDDYWIDEEKLEKQIGFLKNNPEFGLSVSDVKLVNENNDEIEVVKRTEDRIEIIVRRETEPPKTMWVSNAYNAEAYGTDIIKSILGKGQFSYPKSLYAERDCLALAVAGKKDALILDFFAGSGSILANLSTTLLRRSRS